MLNETRIPHPLRLALFFLRLTVGLSFFYLGWSVLFSAGLEAALRTHSLTSLYGWLGCGGCASAGGLVGATMTPVATIPASVFAWIFLIIGILLVIGLFTRLSAIIAFILVIASWLPTVTFANFNPAQFVNDDLIIAFTLIILVLGRAGGYLGLDKFVKWSRRHKE